MEADEFLVENDRRRTRGEPENGFFAFCGARANEGCDFGSNGFNGFFLRVGNLRDNIRCAHVG